MMESSDIRVYGSVWCDVTLSGKKIKQKGIVYILDISDKRYQTHGKAKVHNFELEIIPPQFSTSEILH